MSELAVREERSIVRLDTDQLRYIAHTEFVPAAIRGNLPAIMAAVATGRELGIGDMAALRCIHVIDGRPTLSAEAMVALVRRRGHSIVGAVRDGSARVTGTRADNGDTITVEWTQDMAERAGLTTNPKKQNWKRYPESMLWARAVSQLCRMLFADVFAGGTYTPEEISPDDADYAPLAEGDPSVGSAPAAVEGRRPSPSASDAETTPGEEIAGAEGAAATASASGRGVARPAAPVETTPGEEDLPDALKSHPADPISDAQRRYLFRLAGERGMDDDTMKAIVYETAGISSRKDLTRGHYDAVKRAIGEWEPPDPEDVAQTAIDLLPEDVQAQTRRRMEQGEE